MQGAKNGAKAEDLADDVQEIEAVILKGKKAAEGAGANSCRKLSKAYDDIGKLKNVKRFENEICSLEYEAAKIFDDKENELSGLITQKRLDGVKFSSKEIDKAEKLAVKGNLIITHNHPKNSSISYVDIEMFVANDLKELRAVTKEQKAFCLQKKGKLPSWEEFEKIIQPAAFAKYNQKNAQLINTMRKITNKESQSFINANNKLKQLYADELLYQLRDVIKYTRYQ